MNSKPFQFAIWNVLVLVAVCALILGAGSGDLARQIVIGGLACIVVLSPIVALILVIMSLRTTTLIMVSVPARVRRGVFRRRWARLRPGIPAREVRTLLGKPNRVDGFGDRLYWSYQVADQRFTLALNPRFLLETYSNGLVRDRAVGNKI